VARSQSSVKLVAIRKVGGNPNGSAIRPGRQAGGSTPRRGAKLSFPKEPRRSDGGIEWHLGRQRGLGLRTPFEIGQP
jgi:hypothetical protein